MKKICEISLDPTNWIDDMNCIDADVFMAILETGVSFEEYEYTTTVRKPGRLWVEEIEEIRTTSDAKELMYNVMAMRKYGKESQLKMVKELAKDFL